MKKEQIRAGRPDVDIDALGHTPGVNSGNSEGNYEKQKGHNPDGTRTAEASTGVNAGAHEPIDPRMPNLSPG
ncbi:MAG TPA: hypothetical protein VK304_02755 [Thermoleophilaceae bacterium]|nr:hypothetical protein [Thermoleophilaceae bacterium]